MQETEVKSKNKRPGQKRGWRKIFGISTEERNFFIENLSLLLDSDMGISYTLETLEIQAKSSRMRGAIAEMRQSLSSGAPLWKALQTPGIFPMRLISLIKTGEDAGNLSESLKGAVIELEKDKKFKSKIRSALLYPGMVFFVAVAVVLIASWTILPKLTGLFQDSQVALPLPTRILMGFGHLLQARGAYLIPLALFMIVLLYFILFLWKKTKYLGDWLLFHTPIFRTIIQQTEVARLGFSMGSFMKAGIPVTTAFESLAEGASIAVYRKFYLHIRDRIRQGDSIQKAISVFPKSEKLLPFQIMQIIGSSEKSGKLAETFAHIGEIYEDKADTFTKNIGTIIEPIVVIVIGLIVAGVVIAIIAPIYSLTDAIV